jgi:hypothetical protein
VYAGFSDLSGGYYGYRVGISDLSVSHYASLMKKVTITMFYMESTHEKEKNVRTANRPASG